MKPQCLPERLLFVSKIIFEKPGCPKKVKYYNLLMPVIYKKVDLVIKTFFQIFFRAVECFQKTFSFQEQFRLFPKFVFFSEYMFLAVKELGVDKKGASNKLGTRNQT